jgi:hypothetical protein
VNTRSALDAERPQLRLAVADKMSSLVAAIDRAIDAPAPATPLLRGEIEERSDWTATDVTLTRYTMGSGAATLHLVPAALMTPRVRGRLYDLLVALDEADATRNAPPA